MIHLSNFLRYEFISDVDLLCLFFFEICDFLPVTFLCFFSVHTSCWQKKDYLVCPACIYDYASKNGDCCTRGDQKVLQLLTLVNKMVKING